MSNSSWKRSSRRVFLYYGHTIYLFTILLLTTLQSTTMRYILIFLALFLTLTSYTQSITGRAMVYRVDSDPNLIPGLDVQDTYYESFLAQDTTTGMWWDYLESRGTTWELVNTAERTNATPFGSITGTDVQGQLEEVFASIAPDQTVSITGAGSVAITGTYPNFTATGTGVTGTGTIDYVPKFTTTGAIGNSNIFDNGTNVGIGTTTPLRKLTVSGPETQIRLESTGTVGVDNWLEMVNTSTNIYAANIIQFYKRGGDDAQRHVSIGMPKSSLDSTLYVGITNDTSNDLQNGFLVNMQAGTNKGFVRAEAYSSNRTKTAESLGKTQSAHLAGFATDGTFIHVPMSNGTIAATPDGSGDITVTHTLGSTPTIVQLTAKGTTTPYILSWHSEDGSTFKIRALDASVSPPVAVTTGTISISWNARIN
jgi:hypothetical protein